MGQWEIKRIQGSVPTPVRNRSEVIHFAFAEFARLATQNGAKLIIVVLGSDHNQVQIPYELFPETALVVNAQESLIDSLRDVTEEEYERVYAHWRGNPSKVVDLHPNKTAHRIIAEAIVSSIRSYEQRNHIRY